MFPNTVAFVFLFRVYCALSYALTDYKSVLVQVMLTWRRIGLSNYLNQCWHNSLMYWCTIQCTDMFTRSFMEKLSWRWLHAGTNGSGVLVSLDRFKTQAPIYPIRNTVVEIGRSNHRLSSTAEFPIPMRRHIPYSHWNGSRFFSRSICINHFIINCGIREGELVTHDNHIFSWCRDWNEILCLHYILLLVNSLRPSDAYMRP